MSSHVLIKCGFARWAFDRISHISQIGFQDLQDFQDFKMNKHSIHHSLLFFVQSNCQP
jgi:hypothetical protein